MNAPFFHPLDIDWQDGLNPLAIPAFRQQRNPAVYAALQQPTTVALRNTPGYELRLYVVPDETTPTLAAAASYDAVIQLPAGAWIIGVGASSEAAPGFLVQITMPTGAKLFNRPTRSQDLAARPHYLARPQGITDAGFVQVKCINQAIAPNRCQLVLWVVQPL